MADEELRARLASEVVPPSVVVPDVKGSPGATQQQISRAYDTTNARLASQNMAMSELTPEAVSARVAEASGASAMAETKSQLDAALVRTPPQLVGRPATPTDAPTLPT